MLNDPNRKASPTKIRAYKQAPWREQTRLLAIGLASVFGLMAMMALFIFTGAQAAEAGLRVQSLIRERDRRLRQLEAQEAEFSQKQTEDADTGVGAGIHPSRVGRYRLPGRGGNPRG
jgi:hypothetical protein